MIIRIAYSVVNYFVDINFLFQVIMFWIVDSILMHKRKKVVGSSSPAGIHYHRSSARYNRLKYNVESCSGSDSSEGELVFKKSSKAQGPIRGRELITTQPLASDGGGERETVEIRLDSTEL